MRFALVALLAVATVSGLQVQTARRGAPCAVRALDSRIAAGPADDGAQTPDTLSYVLGAGALSTASYGLVGAYLDTHAPGLAVSALCLFGCWAALGSRFAATR